MTRQLFFLTIAAAATLSAQSVISAHSGTIHYTEGQVTLDGQAVQTRFGEFGDVKNDQVLATQDGRAEILLTPGVFLRLGENSSFKMISNKLTNTRLEVQSGQAMVEVGELLQDNSITVVFHGADISLGKSGLYRLDSESARLRVYEGQASVVSPSADPTTVRKGHEVVLGEAKLEAKSFDTKSTDEFYRWGARRDEYVAQANLSAAKAARDSGYSGMGYSGMGMSGIGGMGYGMGMGSWAWNPWFGMFTYLPFSGTYYSPFGFGYFSPYAVGYLYGPYSPYYYGNGYGGGYSGGGISRNAQTAAMAPAASNSITRAAGFSGGLPRGGPVTSAGTAGTGRGGGFGGGSSASGGSSGASHSGGFSAGGVSGGGGGGAVGGHAGGGGAVGGHH